METDRREGRPQHRPECFQTRSLDLWAFDNLAECSHYAVLGCKRVEKQLAA